MNIKSFISKYPLTAMSLSFIFGIAGGILVTGELFINREHNNPFKHPLITSKYDIVYHNGCLCYDWNGNTVVSKTKWANAGNCPFYKGRWHTPIEEISSFNTTK